LLAYAKIFGQLRSIFCGSDEAEVTRKDLLLARLQ
jgi:hypothetical protein